MKKKKRRARKTKEQITLEQVTNNLEIIENNIPKIVWAFLRANAAKSKLFKHEHEYLAAAIHTINVALKENGERNFCRHLLSRLNNLIQSLEAGEAPYLDIKPHIMPHEPMPFGFKRTNDGSLGYAIKRVGNYPKFYVKQHENCEKCMFKKNRKDNILRPII